MIYSSSWKGTPRFLTLDDKIKLRIVETRMMIGPVVLGGGTTWMRSN